MAADYAIFKVEVAGQGPGLAAIDRTDVIDQNYRTRALVTNSTTANQSREVYQPTLICRRGLAGASTDAKYLGEYSGADNGEDDFFSLNSTRGSDHRHGVARTELAELAELPHPARQV